MIEKENPYSVLNVPENADIKEIKHSFYQLSKIFHPDKQSSELYQLSKEYFERIEAAYKAISSPFSRFLYDNLGYSGIDLYYRIPNKFNELEYQYEELIKKNEEKKNIKIEKEIKDIEQKIINRYFYLLKVFEEQEIYQSLFQNLQISYGLDASSIFIFKNNYNRSFKLKTLSFSSVITLPDIKNIPIQTGFIFTSSKNEIKAGFMFILQQRVFIPKIGNIEGKVNLSFTGGSQSLSIQASKDVKYGVLSTNLNISRNDNNFGIHPSISFFKKFNEDLSINVSSNISSNINFSPIITYEFKKHNIKWKSEFDISADSIEINQQFSKKTLEKIFLFWVFPF